jgi:hypothetical protein
MQQLRLSRRDLLKGAAATGGLAAAGTLLGPLGVLAEQESDGESIVFGPWSPPQPIAELASTHSDYHPAISRDGRSLYFTSDRDAPNFPTEIMVSQREDTEGPWGPPVVVDALNRQGFNSGVPNLEPNGHVIYFNSNRGEGPGGGDLYVSRRHDRRDDFSWGVPVPLPGQLNTTANESGPTYFKEPQTDVASLYFTRFSGKGSLGEASQDWDIYVSLQADDGSFGAGQIVPSLNSPYGPPWSRDTRTAIRRDGLEMFVTTNRHAGQATPTENIWVATRTDTASEDWTMSVQADPNLNSGQGDGGPALSMDGTTLYFFSQRTASGKPGKRQLWTSSRERL